MCSLEAYLYIIKSGQQPQQLSRTKRSFSQEVCFKHWQVRGGIEGRLLDSVCNDAGGPLPRGPWLTSPFLELPLRAPETTVAHTCCIGSRLLSSKSGTSGWTPRIRARLPCSPLSTCHSRVRSVLCSLLHARLIRLGTSKALSLLTQIPSV